MIIKLAIPLYCAAALIATPVVARQLGSPGDGNAAPPVFKYDSAFAGYAPYREEPIEPWRSANESLARGGGRGATGGGMGHKAPTSGDVAKEPLGSAETSPEARGGHGAHHRR